jgi:chromosome segregation ATPase
VVRFSQVSLKELLMDTVTAVREHVTTLASGLDASRREATRLRREREQLLRDVDDARNEARVAKDELLRDRRARKDLLEERERLIRDLEAARQRLTRSLQATQAQLAVAGQRIEQLSERLDAAEERRDAALGELEEATLALTEIRDQLRTNLTDVDAIGGGTGTGLADLREDETDDFELFPGEV